MEDFSATCANDKDAYIGSMFESYKYRVRYNLSLHLHRLGSIRFSPRHVEVFLICRMLIDFVHYTPSFCPSWKLAFDNCAISFIDAVIL